MTGAEDTLLAYVEQVERVAAERERAAIVAWIRGTRSTPNPLRLVDPCAIERGDHLGASDE